MSLARESIITAKGWQAYDEPNYDENEQKRLEFAHTVARLFETDDGKKVLESLVDAYLVKGFSNTNDTQQLLRNSGRADVIKQILAQIEISKNS